MSIPILFQNDELLAVDKPSGIPSQGTRDPRRPSLDVVLKQQLALEELFPVHRLDLGTSGVMLWALDSVVARELSESLQSRAWTKVYWALTARPPTESKQTDAEWLADSWRVDNHLKMKRRDFQGKSLNLNLPTRSGGDRAITDFRRLLKNGSSALIEARPLTGRRHQIRTHLATHSVPIVGDTDYGGESASRLMLHAYSLRWPWRGAALEICAQPPREFIAEGQARGLDLLGESC